MTGFSGAPALLTALVLAFVLATLLVRALMWGGIAKLFADIPNERSLHQTPVPRTGGVGLITAAFATWGALGPEKWSFAVLIAVGLSTVSLVDDAIGLSAGKRLIVQCFAAAALLLIYPVSPIILAPLAFLTLVWMSNLYNFMDGSDGLAGGMTVIGFGAYAIAAHLKGAYDLALLSAALAGGAAGFLVWNFHKARIFMGDAGSVPIGFLAAAIGLLGWQTGVWPFTFPALAFLPFIADATVTLIARFRRGERLSEAHKTHYYQRILQMGLGHRGTALWAYLLMAASAASALMAIDWGPLAAGLLIAVWLAAYALGMTYVDTAWAAFKTKASSRR
jgi:UDP-N-acetylmuramyl pentapeptide phosphotransferase/UDP-N-acetylglucosamine-1-phosphate transferase